MDEDSFMELLHLVTPHIKRRNTVMRDAIPPAERLSITLRFLATGDTYQSLEYLYRIPKQTLSTIIPETCTAIYNVLKERYLKVPSTPEEWERIANDFEMKWNFPNCIGAIDGKHITIRNPVGSGSRFYNYKGFYSIVLMAVVDADYNFIYIDIGCNGRISDGGIFARCSLHERLENSTMSLPPPKPLPGRRNDIPYIIVGDEAFPLKPYLLKPYPSRQLDDPAKQIFNYRLSRARRIVENVFGILSNRFAIFQTPIALEIEKVEGIVLAACALHNFLRAKSQDVYMPTGSMDCEDFEKISIIQGDWRRGPTPQGNFIALSSQGGNRTSIGTREIRDEFCDYFFTNGQVTWQWDKTN
ncbi:uncharacterized protein LOC134233621 [Saccostrea cucullata]|uniref:uncharacterized protein LOC134233621 n=1 Tax=Saccostrea cuccullata TaxID=36930 RepID=UPI002ED3F7FA